MSELFCAVCHTLLDRNHILRQEILLDLLKKYFYFFDALTNTDANKHVMFLKIFVLLYFFQNNNKIIFCLESFNDHFVLNLTWYSISR